MNETGRGAGPGLGCAARDELVVVGRDVAGALGSLLEGIRRQKDRRDEQSRIPASVEISIKPVCDAQSVVSSLVRCCECERGAAGSWRGPWRGRPSLPLPGVCFRARPRCRLRRRRRRLF